MRKKKSETNRHKKQAGLVGGNPPGKLRLLMTSRCSMMNGYALMISDFVP